MTPAERDALVLAVTTLVAADLRWQMSTQSGHYVSAPQAGAAVALHGFTSAAGEVGRLLDPVRPDRFVAKLLRARSAVMDELDPLWIRPRV